MKTCILDYGKKSILNSLSGGTCLTYQNCDCPRRIFKERGIKNAAQNGK
jgi:hypothetical protein